jgi:peptidoglycan-associated lipoprotein
MKWYFAGLLAAFIVDMHAAPADACGIKLVIKTQTPRKAVARSSNPSHLLLLGTPPHRLERELSAAGHDVEVAPTIAAAKQSSYTVVIVDAKQADEAREKWPGAIVIVRSGDVIADIGSVENQVARRPVRTGESRPVVAARAARTPVATGPTPQPRPLAAKEPGETAPVAKEPSNPPAPSTPSNPPNPPRVTTTPQPPVETAPVREPPALRPAPAPTVEKGLREVYFRVGSANLGNKTALLDRAARWLKDSDVQVVIEGYADPTGSHEGNLALGEKRAESVRDYLVSVGIDQSRMEVISYGDTRLKYGRTDGRNRRVAIEPKK